MTDATRTKTAYVILREQTTPAEAPTSLIYEPVQAGIEANSSDQALRGWADNAPAGTPSGVYVAIPARSWNPKTVTFAQETVVKVG